MLSGSYRRLSQHSSDSTLERMHTALWECEYVRRVTVAIYWALWTHGGSGGKAIPLLCSSFLKWDRPKQTRNRGKVLAKIRREEGHTLYRLGVYLQVVCMSFSSHQMGTGFKPWIMIIDSWLRPDLSFYDSPALKEIMDRNFLLKTVIFFFFALIIVVRACGYRIEQALFGYICTGGGRGLG